MKYNPETLVDEGFVAKLFKWRGSMYQLLYRELLVFLAIYGLLSLVYRYTLDENQQKVFEKCVHYFDKYTNMVPLSFIVGFYVATIAGRWWAQYMSIPWPDKLVLAINMYLPGQDLEGRLYRRTLLRYANLMMVLTLRTISSRVRNRFTSMETLVDLGFMTRPELECHENTKIKYAKYWIPSVWFVELLKKAKNQGRVTDSYGLSLIMRELLSFRDKCTILWCYDWVSLPLVYTQVVTLATYTFFLACLFGRQKVGNEIDSKDIPVDVYFPLFTVMQFLFYMGLLKVAEQLFNPFGEDEEDFEVNYLIDRHIKVCYMATDTLCTMIPPVTKDIFFDQDAVEFPKFPSDDDSLLRSMIRKIKPSEHDKHEMEDVHLLPMVAEEGNILRNGIKTNVEMVTDEPIFEANIAEIEKEVAIKG